MFLNIFFLNLLIIARLNNVHTTITTTTTTDAKNAKQVPISTNFNNFATHNNVRSFTTAVSSIHEQALNAVKPIVAPTVSSEIGVTSSVAQTIFTTPQIVAPTKTTSQPLPHAMVPTSSTVQSASNSLMMHFKNLVNVSSKYFL